MYNLCIIYNNSQKSYVSGLEGKSDTPSEELCPIMSDYVRLKEVVRHTRKYWHTRPRGCLYPTVTDFSYKSMKTGELGKIRRETRVKAPAYLLIHLITRIYRDESAMSAQSSLEEIGALE